jgi:hypothetical protein
LAQELEITHASLTATRDKLSSKSTTLDTMVIQEQEAKMLLMKAEEMLMATKEEKMTQGQLLESARQALSKREVSSSMVIALALFKSNLPDLDMEILRKDFTIDDVEREALASSAYDAAHDFVSLYDFLALLSPMMTRDLGLCNSFLYATMNNC